MGTLAGYLFRIPQAIKIPYTLSLRGSDVQVLPYESQEKFQGTKMAIEAAVGIHTVSEALWNSAIGTFGLSYQNLYHKTIYTTVPLGGDKQNSNKNQKKIFVAIGRFHWTKSFPMLLIAFKKFVKFIP